MHRVQAFRPEVHFVVSAGFQMEAAHQAHFLTPSKRIVDADVKDTVHQRHGLGGKRRTHQGSAAQSASHANVSAFKATR